VRPFRGIRNREASEGAHLLFFVGIDCGCVPENGCILNGDAGWRAGRALTERIDGDTGAVAAVRPAAASAFGQR